VTQINYDALLNALKDSPLSGWAELLPEQIARGLCEQRHGDLPAWKKSLAKLPSVSASYVELEHAVRIGKTLDCTEETRTQIRAALEELIPWRKGPYYIHDIHIDTEWRSDWKWDRVLPHLAPLKDRLILDVGCGNGYHCWRMLGAGAKRVIGIDPSPRFIVQFHMIKHFAGEHHPIDVLPLALRPGGQLVLETLVIDGELGDVLVPEERYAMMNNVWFLPSCDTMISWLTKMGFKNPRTVDICPTTTEEQRSTHWMRFHSLPEFLHPDNPTLTAEGHPAPIRAVFVAEV